MKRTEYGCHKCGVESHIDWHEWMEDDQKAISRAIADDHELWSPECYEPNYYVIETHEF